MTDNIEFPQGFLWGSATAAYQVEGSPLADGAGQSIWHRFCHTPGLVANGDTGDVACDHYVRYKEDVALMQKLGMKAYRFSVSWSRILPEGRGVVNARGLDFYERLVDALLAADIEPIITLYHWDLPAALDDLGGWLNRDIAEWFADYGSVLFRRLDDRVEKWATLNEPWVVTDGGYLHGALAPGHRNLFEAPIASCNIMRAHGRAVQAYRAEGKNQVGLVVNIEPKYPASEAEADLAAMRRADAYMNRQYLDPAMLGSCPEEMIEIFGEAWRPWSEEDLALVRQPIDFLGVNYYTRNVTRHDEQAWPVRAGAVRQDGAIYTETHWEMYPQGFTDTLIWVKERYGNPPVYITENGAAIADPEVSAEGKVKDILRIRYLYEHLKAVHAAIRAGADIRGYMVWSLLDNLEWSLGYSKRFGIVRVDFESLKRIPKDSAYFYQKVIGSNGAILDDPLDGFVT